MSPCTCANTCNMYMLCMCMFNYAFSAKMQMSVHVVHVRNDEDPAPRIEALSSLSLLAAFQRMTNLWYAPVAGGCRSFGGRFLIDALSVVSPSRALLLSTPTTQSWQRDLGGCPRTVRRGALYGCTSLWGRSIDKWRALLSDACHIHAHGAALAVLGRDGSCVHFHRWLMLWLVLLTIVEHQLF